MKFFSGIPEHVAFEAWSGFGFAFTDAGFSHVVRSSDRDALSRLLRPGNGYRDISNALFFEDHREWSDALFAVILIAYPWLALITILRSFRFWQAMRSDLFNPRLVFSFLTIVAGTDVFGVGLHLRGFTTAALLLWLFALLVWFILIYFSFAVLTFLNTAHGANGRSWWVADSQCRHRNSGYPGHPDCPGGGQFRPYGVCAHSHVVGRGARTLWRLHRVIRASHLLFRRRTRLCHAPAVGGHGRRGDQHQRRSTLILTERGMPFLDSMRPFMDGVTLIMWAWATWWIPLLLFGVWKRGVCRVPLAYTPMFRCVRLGQPASFARGRLFAVACDILFHGLGCACSLDRDINWACHSVLAELSRFRAAKLSVGDWISAEESSPGLLACNPLQMR